jgi:hypothetical protein
MPLHALVHLGAGSRAPLSAQEIYGHLRQGPVTPTEADVARQSSEILFSLRRPRQFLPISRRHQRDNQP